MKYLEAVIYERMRLFPANGLPLARESPPEGIAIISLQSPAHRLPIDFTPQQASVRGERHGVQTREAAGRAQR